jgi:predicted permease
VGAGLFLRTVANLRHVDVGFDPENLLLVRVMPQATGYDLPRSLELYRTLTERLAALPGARGAALSQPALLSGSTSSTSIYVEGRPAPPPGRGDAGRPSINRLVISPGFFDVYGLPVIRGRGLTPRDDASAPRVTVINETAARQYFPNEDPIGKRFGSRPDHTKDIEIVGIVRDAKYSDLREAAPPTMYDTYMQSPRAVATIAVRTDGAPAALAGAVRNTIHEIDPDLPIAAISTEREQIEKRVAQEKLFAQAYSLFGGIALFLASIGLFGLMSYSVARRTPEMGIRMALGAPRGRVLALIMRESMQLVAIGIMAGLAVAVAAGRLVGTLLFGLAPSDVPTMVTAVVVMAAVAATAAYLPARRAAQVDPNVALRIE